MSETSGQTPQSRPPARRRRRRSRFSVLEIATYALLAAVAIILGYVEALFPLPIPVPGIKLGLGNVVVLFALAGYGWGAGLAIMLIKVIVSSALFGSPTMFVYSIAGAALSFAAMYVALRVRVFSIVGTSMMGGVFHMVGQMIVVAIVLAPYVALSYMPILLVSGLATGLLTGYICRAAIRIAARSALFTRQRKELAARNAAAKQAEQAEQSDLIEQAEQSMQQKTLRGDILATPEEGLPVTHEEEQA